MSSKHVARMRDLLAPAVESLGFPEGSVVILGELITVGDTGLVVEIAPSGGRPKWHVRERYSVADLRRGGAMQEMVDTIMVASLGEEALVAKAAAMSVAERRIDAAIDDAAG